MKRHKVHLSGEYRAPRSPFRHRITLSFVVDGLQPGVSEDQAGQLIADVLSHAMAWERATVAELPEASKRLAAAVRSARVKGVL